MLSAGRVVLTDRLHGHILALQLGIPHVTTEDGEGELRSTLEEWTGAAEVVHWEESPAAGLEAAVALARGAPAGQTGENRGR